MFRKLACTLRFLLKKRRREQDLDTEIGYHVDRQVEENIRRGMTAEQARFAALRTLGAVENIKEECRDARFGRPLEATLQDIRYAVRVLLKSPGFTLTAIVVLALGIGVNTAIFSVVYGILLRPLPYRGGGQLVVLHQVAPRAHVNDIPFSAQEIFDYRDQNHTLDSVVEHHSMTFLLIGKDWAERVQTAVVSANFFETLGVTPLLGRAFRPADDKPGADAVLILSYKYWQTRFGADPDIVGKVFQMNSRPHTVIGVLPPIPQYPEENDVYMPTSACPFRSNPKNIADRNFRMMTAFGRLKPNVSLQQAQADLSTIASRLARTYPDAYPQQYGYGLAAAPLRDDLTRRARNTFFVLLVASSLVLLIACANVANLLLARVLKLEREFALRLALGATRLRLMRQLLTESTILSMAGGALGLIAAFPAIALLVKFASRFTPRALEVKVDTPVLLFTLAVSFLTGLLFGALPAWTSNRQLSDALKLGSSTATAARSRQRFRSALVVAQVAISFMLLIGAGLMLRSFFKLQQVNPGFKPERLLTMRLTEDMYRYKTLDQRLTLARSVLQRVGALGEIQSSALADNFPFNPEGLATDPGRLSIAVEGETLSKGELAPMAIVSGVSPDYFATLRQPLLDGRPFTLHDDVKNVTVAIVNETMARHRWPGETALGRRMNFEGSSKRHWMKVVGVVADAKEFGLARPSMDEVYVPSLPQYLIVRTSLDPMSVAPLIRSALHKLDPQLAIDQVNTIEGFEHESFASPRITALLLGIFALLAAFISASGIAAVLALSVTQRTRELGIRMALGARRESIVRMILRQGVVLTAVGAIFGILGAISLTHLLSPLLYATSPTDVPTFASVCVLFLAVAAAACFIPARQVTSIDPIIALRQE